MPTSKLPLLSFITTMNQANHSIWLTNYPPTLITTRIMKKLNSTPSTSPPLLNGPTTSSLQPRPSFGTIKTLKPIWRSMNPLHITPITTTNLQLRAMCLSKATQWSGMITTKHQQLLSTGLIKQPSLILWIKSPLRWLTISTSTSRLSLIKATCPLKCNGRIIMKSPLNSCGRTVLPQSPTPSRKLLLPMCSTSPGMNPLNLSFTTNLRQFSGLSTMRNPLLSSSTMSLQLIHTYKNSSHPHTLLTSPMMSPLSLIICTSQAPSPGMTTLKNQQFLSSPMTTAPIPMSLKKNHLPISTTTSIMNLLPHTFITNPQSPLGQIITKPLLSLCLSTQRTPTFRPQSPLLTVNISTWVSPLKNTCLISQLKLSGVSTTKNHQLPCIISINPLSLITLTENPLLLVPTSLMTMKLRLSPTIHLFQPFGLISMKNQLSLFSITMKDQMNTFKTICQLLLQVTSTMMLSPNPTPPTSQRRLTGPITTLLLHSLSTTTTSPLKDTLSMKSPPPMSHTSTMMSRPSYISHMNPLN